MKLTQYLRPDGRRKEVVVVRSDDIEEAAADVVAHGWRFECEVLRTGEVSLTVFDPEDEVDVAVEITTNGPEVLTGTDRLVRAAHRLLPRPA